MKTLLLLALLCVAIITAVPYIAQDLSADTVGPCVCKGPAIMMPSSICADGSIAGPICEQYANHKCGTVIKQCSGSSSPSSPPPSLRSISANCLCPPRQRWDRLTKKCLNTPPVTCPMASGNVCGCDGKPYFSICVAANKGVKQVTAGACK